MGNIQAYSDISRTLCNHARLRTIAHLELEAHLEPCQRSTMKRFVKIVKIVHDYIFDANHNYCRDISSSRSLLYGMNTIFFKYRSNFYFWSIYSTVKKVWWPRGPGALNFVILGNFIKEQLLHNLRKYFSDPWANQIVNKALNGELSCLSNLSFFAS